MALTIKWINHIEAWQNSGLKQSEYCRQQLSMAMGACSRFVTTLKLIQRRV